MRSAIASKFPAYTFERIDSLLFDDVIEHYASAQWLGDEEARQAKRKGQPRS